MKNLFKEVSNFSDFAENIEIFADNTQRKKRTSRVKEDAITPIGIGTNVVIIPSYFKSFIEKSIKLSPIYNIY